MLKTEKISCPICNSKSFCHILTTKDFRCSNFKDEFRLVKCKKCGVFYVNPRPVESEIYKFYPENYYSSKIFWGIGNYLIEKITKIYRKRAADLVLKYKKGGLLLDIGCGTGDFLFEMKKRGFRVVGNDVSAVACKLARKKGLRVINKKIEECGFSRESFDIITLWHVLEHLHYPRKALKTINKLLKTKGILIIEVPNIESISFKFFGKYFFHLDIPRHLFHWSYSTLSYLLELEGFEILEYKYLKFNSLLSLFRSFSRFLEEKSQNILIRKIAIVFFIPLLFFLTMFRFFLPSRKSDILRIVARKIKI